MLHGWFQLGSLQGEEHSAGPASTAWGGHTLVIKGGDAFYGPYVQHLWQGQQGWECMHCTVNLIESLIESNSEPSSNSEPY